MSSIFSENIYSHLVKYLRNKNNDTLTTLSQHAYMDASTLSRLERGDGITLERIEPIIQYYQYDIEPILLAQTLLSDDMNNYINYSFEIRPDLDALHDKIIKNYSQYNNILFHITITLCDIIYNSFDGNDIHISRMRLNELIEYKYLFSISYQTICNVYLANWFSSQNNENEATRYFDSVITATQDPKILALYYYYLAIYHLNKNQCLISIEYSRLALRYFSVLQLYNHLIDINILNAQQYRQLNCIKKAIEIDMQGLKNIDFYPIYHKEYKKNTLLSNIITSYIMIDDYDEALIYCHMINDIYKSEKSEFDEALCYYIKEDFEQVKIICKKSKAKYHSKSIYHKLIKWLNDYCNNIDNQDRIMRLELLYEKDIKQFRTDEQAVLLKLLMKAYELNGELDKALDLCKKIMIIQASVE